jgi:hypothetical protein
VAINNSKFKQNSPDNDILHLILGIHAKACACFEKLRVGAKKLLVDSYDQLIVDNLKENSVLSRWVMYHVITAAG